MAALSCSMAAFSPVVLWRSQIHRHLSLRKIRASPARRLVSKSISIRLQRLWDIHAWRQITVDPSNDDTLPITLWRRLGKRTAATVLLLAIAVIVLAAAAPAAATDAIAREVL